MDKPPQLVMRREGLTGLPRTQMEFGYLIRTYRPGDDVLWCSLMEGNIGTDWTAERFHSEMFDAPQFDPHGLFFVTIGSRPAGTACAWRAKPDERHTGILHMVTVCEQHRSRGLAKYLTFRVLEYFRDRGFSCCTLKTDDWRLPAIKAYLALGFRPEFTHDSHQQRWEAVFRKMGRPMPEPVNP